ncbi:MAG: hypothetical protein KDB06_13145 [Ilumatobacter sp.]|nr:hypothetical protein [Ilumatobacter sp.]MCB0981879.1 hypothetical protein [Ilumatobacter sp.]MCB0985588.1 hypothetical protein [Ilumatobacter sp.]MCB9381308.1 hypothetical protein [Acidimicrobiaceae bacterium]MCO5332217.1 hypothetical protein [Ilumatobacteraceae bacterium]
MKKHLIGFSAIVLAGSLGIATVASASEGDGTGPGAGRGRRGDAPALTDEQKCEHQDQIVERANNMLARMQEREAKVEEFRATAEAAGETNLVERLDTVLERMAGRQDKVETRIAEFQSWAGEHCTVTTDV